LTLVGQRVAHGMRQAELEAALEAAGFRVDCWGDGALPDLREAARLRSARVRQVCAGATALRAARPITV
jgi:hypothetical protein